MEFGEETAERDSGDENYTAEKSDKIIEDILSSWNFGGDWAENRIPYEKRSANSYSDGLIIDDIDISENNTCILVTKSFFGNTVFHRIPTNRSLFAFEISSGFRQFCMRLYCSRHYKVLGNLITLLHVVLTILNHNSLTLWFLFFFIVDSVLASVSRGLILHKKAYLRDYWNILDFGITLFELLKLLYVIDVIYSFLYGIDFATVYNNVHINSGARAPRLITNAEDKVYNFDLGITRFARSLRLFRLMNTLKNIRFLREFRLILRVFLSLFPKMVLLSILIVLILVNGSILATNLFKNSFYQICLPESRGNDEYLFTFNDVSNINVAVYHPCSNLSLLFTYNCPEKHVCVNIPDQTVTQLFHRLSSLVNFDRLDTTFTALLLLISTEDYDFFYYRIIFQTGYLGFIFCAITCLFGFFILALILALIYDSYNEEIEKTPDVEHIHYFDGESDFPFDLEAIDTCEYNALLEANKKINNKEFLHRYVLITREIPQENGSEDDKVKDEKVEEDLLSASQSVSSLIDEFSEILRDMISTRLTSIVISASIVSHYVVLLNYRFYNDRDGKNVLNSILETAETLISFNFVIEMMVKLIAFRLQFFKIPWNVFDLFVVVCALLNELGKRDVHVLSFLKYFRALRMFHFLMDNWLTMSRIVASLVKCFKIVLTTFLVFCAIFIYFCIISYLLFETFRGSIDELDLLDISLGFDKPRNVLRTVFLMVVPSAWQEILQQLDFYLQSTNQPQTDEIIRETSFIHLIPYSFHLFVFFGHLYHLIFTDILIPQFFNELKVERLEDEVAEVTELILERVEDEVAEDKQKQIFYDVMRENTFRYLMILLLFINLITFRNQNKNIIYISVLLHFIFVCEFLFHINAGGIFYDKKTGTYAWKCTIFTIDLVTICASIYDLIIRYFSKNNYTGSFYVSILASLSCLRMIRHTNRLKLWFKILITHWRRMLNVVLFCVFILTMYAIAGIQLFGGKLYFCEQTRGGGYSIRSTRRYVSHETVWFACVTSNSSISSKEELSFTTKRVYPYNFDEIFTGILTTFQMIYGDEIYETIGALTSVSNLETGPQRRQFANAWFFIVPVTFTGIVLDTLVFAAVSSNFDVESQPDDSVWRLCKDDSRLNTLLALNCIRRVKPWNVVFVPTQTVRYLIYQLLNSKLYDNVIFSLMVFNVVIIILVDDFSKIEFILLVIYCVDGLLRLLLVGEALLSSFWFLFALDIVLPFFLLASYVFKLNLLVAPSLWITIRIIAPDRYIRFDVLKGGKLILNALIASVYEQSTMLVAFLVFLALFTSIGTMLFSFTDTFGAVYSPEYYPPVYNKYSTAFTHLFSVAFGSSFDVSIITLITRSQYCNLCVPRVTENLVADFVTKEALNPVFDENDNGFNCNIDDLIKKLVTKEYLDKLQPFLEEKVGNLSSSVIINDEELLQQNVSKYISRIAEKYPSNAELFCQQKGSYFWIQKALRNELPSFVMLNNCAKEFTIKLFYVIFVLIAKLLLLNMMKCIVLEEYKKEKRLFDNRITEDDIAEFIQKFFEEANKSELMVVEDVTLFVSLHSPKKFKIISESDGYIESVFMKYRLPIRQKDNRVHVFDLLAVCVAHSFRCNFKTHEDFQKIVRHTKPHVTRLFSRYEQQSHINMKDYLRRFYYGKTCVAPLVIALHLPDLSQPDFDTFFRQSKRDKKDKQMERKRIESKQ